MLKTRSAVTLNTFHFAGVSSKRAVPMGIPRLKELLDASKTPKSSCTTLRLRDPYASFSEFAEYLSHTIPLTRLGDIVACCDIIFDPDVQTTVVQDDEWIVHTDFLLSADKENEGHSRYVIRLKLQQDMMRTRHLTPPIVRRMLSERLQGRATVASSETNAVDWIVRIRFNKVAHMINDGELSKDHEAIICHRAVNVLLETAVICGHPDISSAVSAEMTKPEGDVEHVVHVGGNLLCDCVALQCVEWERTTSDNVWDVLNILGIEACAHVLFDQLRSVVSFDGTYVDDRHLMLIVDTMCRNGSLMPLNRHGINRTDSSPFMRCSFEETLDVLCDAGLFAESENARGTSTSIMTGHLAEFGTGCTQVLFPSQGIVQPTLNPRGRAFRSTCRCAVQGGSVQEDVEYVFDDVRPGGGRVMSPPRDDDCAIPNAKRVRFRPTSPDCDV